MRRVGAVIRKHGATVVALHEHLMLFVATYIGQQRADKVLRASDRRFDCCVSQLRRHVGVRRDANNRSDGRGSGDQKCSFRHLVVSFLLVLREVFVDPSLCFILYQQILHTDGRPLASVYLTTRIKSTTYHRRLLTQLPLIPKS